MEAAKKGTTPIGSTTEQFLLDIGKFQWALVQSNFRGNFYSEYLLTVPDLN